MIDATKWLFSICLLSMGSAVGAQPLRLPAGDVQRGRRLIGEQGCLLCHRAGSTKAPELTQNRGRGFLPFVLAGKMWNHAPPMWREMGRSGVLRPSLGPQQAADLFAFLFSMQSFEEPGNAVRGKRIFQPGRCGGCHGTGQRARSGISAVLEWSPMEDAADLAQRGSSHTRSSGHSRHVPGDPRLRLSPQEMRDVAAYVLVAGRRQKTQDAPAARARSGSELLAAQGCTHCHAAGRSLTKGRTRFGLSEFAAAMWRHEPMPVHSPAMTGGEMRALLEFLVALQFLDELGDRDRGELVFAQKRCIACHRPEARTGPDLTAQRGRWTSYEMVAVLWKHGPEMLEEMKRRNIPWPAFRESEMADLVAYLHGPEFQLRDAGGGAGPKTGGTPMRRPASR